MRRAILATTSSLLLAGACGGDGAPASDPGGGTRSLLITGSVTAAPARTNARAAADFSTAFTIRVSLDNVPVSTGTVMVTSDGGEHALAYDAGTSRWEASVVGYDEVYTLDVISGVHEATGVRVNGPDIHTFKEPTAGTTVDASVPLEVSWNAGEKADMGAIRADKTDWISIADERVYTLAPGALDADPAEARSNELRLARTNRVLPAGATAGSEFAVRLENRVEIVAEPL